MRNAPLGDYGYDAPYALIAFAGVAVVATVCAGAARLGYLPGLFRPAVGYAGFFGLNAASFYYTTRHGKFQEWDRPLHEVSLSGDEQVLDMGCGRGAVLNAVARRLTTGHATGIDLWRSIDQSGNAPDATMANARAEGVAERISLETGDMRSLPFADASFDVVVSSLAIHNPARQDRAANVTRRRLGWRFWWGNPIAATTLVTATKTITTALPARP